MDETEPNPEEFAEFVAGMKQNAALVRQVARDSYEHDLDWDDEAVAWVENFVEALRETQPKKSGRDSPA